MGEYLKEARANGVPFVPLERRKFILDWLAGEGLETGELDISFPQVRLASSCSLSELSELNSPSLGLFL